jgi:hypothetical protein
VDVADRFIAERNHPAVVIPTVVEACDFFKIARDTVRFTKFCGLGNNSGELLQGS